MTLNLRSILFFHSLWIDVFHIWLVCHCKYLVLVLCYLSRPLWCLTVFLLFPGAGEQESSVVLLHVCSVSHISWRVCTWAMDFSHMASFSIWGLDLTFWACSQKQLSVTVLHPQRAFSAQGSVLPEEFIGEGIRMLSGIRCGWYVSVQATWVTAQKTECFRRLRERNPWVHD